MKKPFALILITYIFLSIYSCQNPENKNEVFIPDKVAESGVSIEEIEEEYSPDFLGIYQGILPCEDCEGIQITLEMGPASSYVKKEIYLGKRDQKTNKTYGIYSWNQEGNAITLEKGEFPNRFLVEENRLYLLDAEGKKMAGNFILTKE